MIENPVWAAVCQRWADRERRQVIESFHLDCAAPERAAETGSGRIAVTDQRIWLNGLPEAFSGLRAVAT